MKKMGTITKYFPFVDEETKSVLGTLMDESSNYYDFVQRLCTTALENEVSINLAYIAASQAWWTRKIETMRLIQEKYIDVPCIIPWGYQLTSAVSDQVEYHDAVVKAINKAIAQPVDDWMAIELHLLHTTFHWPTFGIGDFPSFLEPLEKAKVLLEANSSLSCFESLICCFEGWSNAIEIRNENALAFYQRGKELAWVFDDALYRYMNLLDEAWTLGNSNVQQAISKYEELYELAQELQVPYFVAEILNDSALVYETAGEYDLAISSHIEGMKIQIEGMKMSTPSLILSRIYSTLGDGESALEWANKAFDYAGHIEYPQLYLRKAWALALLNRFEEAQQHLDISYSLILKIGQEIQLGRYYQASGAMELARGDYLASLDFLEKAQEIGSRYPFMLFQNNVLLDLAHAEILLSDQSTASTKSNIPGKWLSRLEKHAIDHDLLGIRMQAAMLKAEFYINHKQFMDAHAILVNALDISDSPGVATLRKKISNRIKEINRLIHDEEMAS